MARCLICNSSNLKLEDKILVCCKCGFYRSLCVEQKSIILHYDSYDSEKHMKIAKSQVGIYDIMEKEIISFLNETGIKPKVLEIGFGHGHFLKRLIDLNFKCYGVDISRSALENALSIGIPKENLILGDFLSIDFNDKFDVVIMNGVIEEFENPVDVIKKIYEISTTKSMLIIRTKNASFHRFIKRYFRFLEFFIRSIGVFAVSGFTYRSIDILLNRYNIIIKKVFFKLTDGDPYNQFTFSFLLSFLKRIYSFLSHIVFYISFKRIVLSPSFIIIATKR